MADEDANSPTAAPDRFPDRSVALSALEARGRGRGRDADSWTSTRKAALFEGYELKLNSYDLGVDIELADAIERLRFEHPEVRVVLLRSGKPRVFCAGANIRMLAGATHGHKVNFCKFTNETRSHRGCERAFRPHYLRGQRHRRRRRLRARARADHIILVDDLPVQCFQGGFFGCRAR